MEENLRFLTFSDKNILRFLTNRRKIYKHFEIFDIFGQKHFEIFDKGMKLINYNSPPSEGVLNWKTVLSLVLVIKKSPNIIMSIPIMTS